jgi:ParB family transcriptional regulator, chromosome partitioning protein
MTRKNIFKSVNEQTIDDRAAAEEAVASSAGLTAARESGARISSVRPLIGASGLTPGAGPVGALGKALGEFKVRNKIADEIESKLASGQTVVELDPALLDPSPFQDRLPDDTGADLASLSKSIEEEGQKVPIQVRPNPAAAGRYQIAYGHRRWRVLSNLGRAVRAVVLELTDEQLAIAQGIENSARQDLAWVERALFAARMEKANLKPRDVIAALSIDHSELAKMRTVTTVLSPDLLHWIGRAPAVGRPRWFQLAEAVKKDSSALERIQKIRAAAQIAGDSSDQRFAHVLAAALPPDKATDVERLGLLSPTGGDFGALSFGHAEAKIAVEKQYAIAFRAFLKDEIGPLVEKFFARYGGKDEPS